MSAQIHDKIYINNKFYDISAIESEKSLFDISFFGIKPTVISSSCWRGYVASFKVDNENRLLLNKLSTNIEIEDAPVLNGVTPIKIAEINLDNISGEELMTLVAGNTVYMEVNLPIDFTGLLYACDGFIKELYAHEGFHEPHKYNEVFKLHFVNGKCINISEMSLRAKGKRESINQID